MVLLLTSHPYLFFRNPRSLTHYPLRSTTSLLSLFSIPVTNRRFSYTRLSSTITNGPDESDPSSQKPPTPGGAPPDEWGEKSEPEPEPEPESSYSEISDADPPKDEDEWGSDDIVASGNGSTAAAAAAAAANAEAEGGDKLAVLKQCLVDTVYGTNFGFQSSAEARGEVLELVNQLEAANPTPAPVEAVELLDGNWVLLFTAFSELFPILAAGTTPLLRVGSISQEIDTKSLTIKNNTTLSSPFATFSFSASATFEVRSPSRIQVAFKEGILDPPEIKSRVDLPEKIDIFGQKVNLYPLQQVLNPLQEAAASISRSLSGQRSLKLPIPRNRGKSWLLTTYLDKDLRISRGDGGLFILVKERSPLLDSTP